MSVTLKFCKIVSTAFDLVKATPQSVGFDIKAIEDVELQPWNHKIIRTGIKILPPDGTYIRIASRSGLAAKGITVEGGVIDPDYTGEIKVILYNHSDEVFQVECGMKIAQLIAERVVFPTVIKVDHLSEQTKRGDSGFGSSGL